MESGYPTVPPAPTTHHPSPITQISSPSRYTFAMQLLLAGPRGFCAGVSRAVEIVERVLEIYGPPVYVKHEIIHNHQVVDDLRNRGAVFVESLDEVPSGSPLIFSAHGVPPSDWTLAQERGLKVIDATCPLVTKVHLE